MRDQATRDNNRRRLCRIIGLLGRRARLSPHLNLFTFNPDFEAINFQLWVIDPCPVTNFKTPRMPRAGDDSVFDEPRAERRTHMRANIIDRRILAVIQKYRHHAVADRECRCLAVFDIANFGHCQKFGHDKSSLAAFEIAYSRAIRNSNKGRPRVSAISTAVNLS